MRIPCTLLLVLALLAGCSSVDTKTEIISNVRVLHHFFVRTASNDSNHVDALIVQELQRLGYDASSGPRTMMPNEAEAVIDYEGQWTWDFRTYLIQLNVTIRDARTEAKLAGGQVFHPGVTTKTPEELVHAVLAPIFAPKKK